MSCERCSDIHSAQIAGKTTEACKCSCHEITYPIKRQSPWVTNQKLVTHDCNHTLDYKMAGNIQGVEGGIFR